MPQGLQCWDATGKLVVDIGDYNLRFVRSREFTFPANTGSYTLSDNGITADGVICVVRSTASNENIYPVYYGIPINGGVIITTTNSNIGAKTLILDVMTYI